mmetsp:Transcript_5995/g.7636  ORF Transcript_5995/g.7636 Transcript_5995/m.7636 type:complete len:605 (+) Transcript_5995:30-1844(+)
MKKPQLKSRKRPTTNSNLHYRSARAVAPSSSDGKNKIVSNRCKWNIIKLVIFVSGSALVLSSLYLPFIVPHDGYSNSNAPKTLSQASHSVAAGIGSLENIIHGKKREVVDIENQSDVNSNQIVSDNHLGRGISGLPMSETPALVGASRGHIDCEVDVDRLVYWNDPQGTRDVEFKSPFIGDSGSKPKYITFEPDRGGWNNIRMNLEIIFILAAATGRTLVLPPPVPMYLLNKDKGSKHRGFGDFFPIHEEAFKRKLEVISMEEFLKREGGDDGQFPIPEDDREQLFKSSVGCDKKAKSDIACDPIFDYLETSADLIPQWNTSNCLVFDEDMFNDDEMSQENKDRVASFCSPRKDYFYVTPKSFNDHKIVHIKNSKGWRILAHYYGYMYFTNPAIYNYYKRFVRDFMHYHDEIYCAAGKIVLALQEEGNKRGFSLDKEGGGGFASLHVRRGDLQYKKVKISAEEWYENLKETFQDNEIIYIATDERNKTFFDPIKQHTDVKFLDDYWKMAKLDDLDPNYMGMIDTIVASRGRVFGGTFRSTFTGYINRMRGYHGMTMKSSYYSFLEKKNVTHEWKEHYDGISFAYEWPDGWVGIDGEKEPSKDIF